jgi:hypothetical protein
MMRAGWAHGPPHGAIAAHPAAFRDCEAGGLVQSEDALLSSRMVNGRITDLALRQMWDRPPGLSLRSVVAICRCDLSLRSVVAICRCDPHALDGPGDK